MIGVLNTRPAHQAKAFSLLIEKNGMQAIELPLIKIEPVLFETADVSQFDFYIFTSSNAVDYFFKLKKEVHCIQKAIAVGPATQKTLEKYGVFNVICPNHFSSEGILSLPNLQVIDHQKILIITGENTKPFLKTALEDRNATVTVLTVYKRSPIHYELSAIFPKINSAKVIVATSFEHFLLLCDLFKNKELLFEKKLIVVNDKTKSTAIEMGFRQVFQSENPTDEAVIATINSSFMI